jgi:hypothetical protein
MKKSIFQQNKRYSFSDYFNLSNPVEEIVAELGYQIQVEEIKFPILANIDMTVINQLIKSHHQLLPKISFNSETAKREFLIAPLLYQVVLKTDSKLNIEYPIDINDKLNGWLDYLIRSQQEIVVIEAKKGDLEKGFTQLAAEMIALDYYEDEGQPSYLYGAITIGEVWRFAVLDRKNKTIKKDINLFRFPQDAQDLFAVLLGILTTT